MEEYCIAHEQVWAGITTLLEFAAIEEVEKIFVILCLKASTLWQGQGAV